MTAHCQFSSVGQIPEACAQAHVREFVHQDAVHLVPGLDYVVYAISFRNGHPWFWICEEVDATYPKPHWAGFFTLKDPAVPGHWVLDWQPGNPTPAMLLPASWAELPNFFERLLDDDPEAMERFGQERAARGL